MLIHRNADDGEYWVRGDLNVVPGKVMESEILRDGNLTKLNNSLPVGDQDEVTILIKIRGIHPGVLGR